MRDLITDVAAFHTACDQPTRTAPEFVNDELRFRIAFTHEEVNETKDAIDAGDMVKIADGLGDIMYVQAGNALYFGVDPDLHAPTVMKALLAQMASEFADAVAHRNQQLVACTIFKAKVLCLGIASHYGIPFDEVWALIHSANMGKVDPETGKVTKNGEGKVMKPVGWTAPDSRIAVLLHDVGL